MINPVFFTGKIQVAMISSSYSISSSFTSERDSASAAAGSTCSHPVHFSKGESLLMRQDSEYCRQYLRDMHALFSKKILGVYAGDGKEKEYMYQPIAHDYLDERFFLEIEGTRKSPLSAGGFGRGSISESQGSFNRLLFDVIKETIRDANTVNFTYFDSSKPRDLLGLAQDQRTMRLPISLGNFMSRIEGVVLKAFSSKIPDQTNVIAALDFARPSEAKVRRKEAIDCQSEQSMEQMVDVLAAEGFRKWLTHPDLHQQFNKELFALDRALAVDFQTLTGYCSQLEELPIGSEGGVGLVAEICTIRDRIIALLGSLGFDPRMEELSIRECNDLVENAVKKHRVFPDS